MRWGGSGGGGFAAFGGNRTVSLGGGAINWTATNFIGGGRTLFLSHETADATLIWQKAVSTAGGNRTINVANGSALIDAELNAVFSGGTSGTSNAITKAGEGTLALTAQNSHWGNTNINAGMLMIGNGGATGGISQNSPNIIVAAGATLAANRSNTLTQGTNALVTTISGAGSFEQVGAGTTVLTLDNTYGGTTTASNGILQIDGSHSGTDDYAVGASGSLVVNGSVSTSLVTVNGSLSGRGTLPNATLAGSGSINPGNSPGILTAAATDPTAGLGYNFEFTAANTAPAWDTPAASVNDVLRLTSAEPFTDALTSANTISFYLNIISLSEGDVFTGGFFTDNDADFMSAIGSGTYQFFLADDGGSESYLGNTYSSINSAGFSVATVAQIANFGAGVVDGYVTQFTYVIPEPSAALLGGIGTLLLLRRRRD